MAATQMNGIIRHLRQAMLRTQTDRQLLEALVSRRDADAFEAIVDRHGPMVLAVCRRVLRDEHDAEDAFQSTFLVLLRKATNIRKPEAIGSWLYGVAYLVSRKVRLTNARRRAVERQSALQPRPLHAEHDSVLDDELNRLPEKYRTPLVLCELEGRSRREAAGLLGIAEGTLSSRLAMARKMLASRLRRRGWALSGAVPIAAILPDRLRSIAAKAGKSVLSGRGSAGVVPTEVIQLSNGVLRAMLINRLKTLSVAALMLGLLGGGVDRIAHRMQIAGSASAAQEPISPTDPVQRAVAELQAAEEARTKAEAELAAIRARLARKQMEYRELLVKESTRRANHPEAQAEVAARAQSIASHFKYRIPVETGRSQSQDGGRIEILDVWGTQPEIKVGGYYMVHGKYSMPSHERGTLYFHMSATDLRFAYGNELDLQYTKVHQGDGEFTLMHAMVGTGYFHLQLAGENSGQFATVADVYFGTGDNVYRGK
jgi:RNA polymerase sigma factor (sigma-70 family)